MLVAAGVIVIGFPDVAVNGKAGGDVRTEANDDGGAQNAAGNGGKDGADIAGGHKGDDKENNEEDEGGAEIADEDEGADADDGIGDKGIDVSAGLNFFKGHGADEDEGNFNKFGGLEGDAGDFYPVAGAVGNLGDDEVYGEEGERGYGDGEPQFHTEVCVAQEENQDDENNNTAEGHEALLKGGIGVNGADGGKTDGAEEEGDEFKLKVAAVENAVEEDEVEDFGKAKDGGGEEGLIAEFAGAVGGGEGGNELKEAKEKENGEVIHGPNVSAVLGKPCAGGGIAG